ncbi:MAG: serine--tRNA ligase [Patescibacteria group bacterium]
MLDLKFILENKGLVKKNSQMRNVDIDLDSIEHLALERKKCIYGGDDLRGRANKIANEVKNTLDNNRRRELVQEGKQLKEKLNTLEMLAKKYESELRIKLLSIPNLTHPNAPIGKSDADNKEIKKWGEICEFDFKPKDHIALGNLLNIIDFDSGTKTTGNKFYFLKNDGVLLEFALVQYVFEILMEEGFELHTTPDLARLDIIESIGFIPRGPEAQIYQIANEELGLVATAEITLGGMHRDDVFPINKLPAKLAGISHCFRTEAGAYGKTSKGLYRVHQFTKVEMFIFSLSKDSENMLDHILKVEEKIFQGLGIPYRIVDCCTADLGGSAYRKFDIEAWMPADKKWGEVTSASNCTDYQSRRLNIKMRNQTDKKLEFVHTLNGTAIAISRAIIAILENFQEEDGSVKIPPSLQKWMGKNEITKFG